MHGSYDIPVYKNNNLTLGFFYSNFEFSKLLIVNSYASYWFNKEKISRVYLGLGVTNIKTLIFYAGASFKGVIQGIAYDKSTFSDNLVHRIQSGIELCASYIGQAKVKTK